MTASRHPVLAVIGASGGAGASALCAALALGRQDPSPLLMDLDAAGGGIDLLLGIEDRPGARWSDLRLGGGELEPARLADRLPAWGGASVLAAAGGVEPSAAVVGQLLAAARVARPVVVDVPRWLPSGADAVLAEADAALLVVPSEVRSVVAAARLRADVRRDWPDGAGRRIAAVARPGAVEIEVLRAHLEAPTAMLLPVHDWLGGDEAGALRSAEFPRAIRDVARAAWAWAAEGIA